VPRDQVFISYSHEDTKWREDLEKHLKPYLRAGSIKGWSDKQIIPGSKWFEEIKSALVQTNVAVLLVTPDFLASDFIHEHELGPLLKEAERSGVTILWVPIYASAYKQTALDKYQAVIDPNRPLASFSSKAKRDEAWVTICEEIQEAVKEPRKPLPPSPSAAPRAVSQEVPANVHGESKLQAKAENTRLQAMSLPQKWIELSPKPRELSGGDQWNVALSYRPDDRAWVLNLYDVLRNQGHKVFLDECVLKPGDPLRRIGEALRASQSVVVVLSTATKDFDWVRLEYQAFEPLAKKKEGFQFIPVKLDTGELPAYAQERLVLDFSAYPDGPNGGELLRLMHAVVGLPLSDKAAHFADQQDEAAKGIGAKIGAAIKNRDPERLVELFREGGLAFETSATLGCKVAEGLTKLGSNDLALSVLAELESRFPRAIRPKQLHALALARRGAGRDLRLAQEILGELYDRGERDPETLEIYGRTWMDRYEKSGDRNALKQSRDLYIEAFERAPVDYYAGINAAAKSVLLGTEEHLARAAEYARKVQQIVGMEPRAGDYWMTATVAEAFLIQKKYEEAARLYEAAVATARSETGSHKTTWKQACRLMAKLQPSQSDRELVREPFMHLPDCDQL
jgi:hypothetical protein